MPARRDSSGKRSSSTEAAVVAACIAVTASCGHQLLLSRTTSDHVVDSAGTPSSGIAAALSELPPTHDAVTLEAGAAIAQRLDLRQYMRDLVHNYPGATFLSEDPPIIKFPDFLAKHECEALIEFGKPLLRQSVAVRKRDQSIAQNRERTSENAWCMPGTPCVDHPTTLAVDNRIANLTGFPHRNLEYYQILRYKGRQGYQAHADWAAGIKELQGFPSGPRLFTIFLYLNTVDPAAGGSTWFPGAPATNDTGSAGAYWHRPAHSAELREHYRKRSKRPVSTAQKFADIGLRIVPEQGTAIMWPNVDLDNVYVQNEQTVHAAEELEPGHVKWAANAW